jgi:hypothetical protein
VRASHPFYKVRQPAKTQPAAEVEKERRPRRASSCARRAPRAPSGRGAQQALWKSAITAAAAVTAAAIRIQKV